MVEPEDSILKVRRSIHIKGTPERVWQAFASKSLMDKWWGRTSGSPGAGMPQGHWLTAYEPWVGGRIEMALMLGSERARYGGLIRRFEQGRELTFENDWIPSRGWLEPTFITIRLTSALEGTVVELFHHGFERTGSYASAEHAGYEIGWGMLQLMSLRELIEDQVS